MGLGSLGGRGREEGVPGECRVRSGATVVVLRRQWLTTPDVTTQRIRYILWVTDSRHVCSL